jgi:hypothetical protein
LAGRTPPAGLTGRFFLELMSILAGRRPSGAAGLVVLVHGCHCLG